MDQWFRAGGVFPFIGARDFDLGFFGTGFLEKREQSFQAGNFELYEGEVRDAV